MSGYSIGKTVIIYKDRFSYSGLASMTILDNGEWLLAFRFMQRLERYMHCHPQFRVYLTRTSDQGGTWERPYFAPDVDWPGGQMCPGVSRLSNGTVVLTISRPHFCSLSSARKRRAAGETIFISLPGRGWTEDFTDDDWGRSEFSWAFGYYDYYIHLSTDRGHTFEDTIKLDPSPYRDAFNRAGVVELQDGRVAHAVCGLRGSIQQHLFFAYVLFSSTGGQSWDPPILIAKSPDLSFSEPCIAEVAPGELYCTLRDDIHQGGHGYLYGCRSLDGGHSWSVPEATPMFAGASPGHLLVLRDGRLLCTYGRRAAPFGIRACLSKDRGRTWEIDQEIVIRNDLPNADLGYPVTIEYAPGRLFSCYYGQDPDWVTCIQGNHVTLT